MKIFSVTNGSRISKIALRTRKKNLMSRLNVRVIRVRLAITIQPDVFEIVINKVYL